ncbi:hypothetical protein ACFOYU_06135 [Microvirga sp. GCM10011540]|uniref:hypothetical protein n=1 Tax=Microvirga sp. GCM10011540 TaxID=3317338 RepID=UPI003617E4F9
MLDPAPAPDPTSLETLSTLKLAAEALLLVVDAVDDKGLVYLLGELSEELSEQRWHEAALVRDALLEQLPEAFHDHVRYACAAGGFPGAAADIACRYASIAQDLTHWLREEGWKFVSPNDDERDPVAEVAERLRTVAGMVLGWGAVAQGRTSEGLSSGHPADHAASIATLTDATVWHGVMSAAWKTGFERALRHERRMKKMADAATRSIDEERAAAARGEAAKVDGVVVVRAIGSPDSSGGKEAGKAIASILGKALPVVKASTVKVEAVRIALSSEFPHGASIIQSLLADIRPDQPIRLRPTVLLGDPGGGKSRLARRLLEELGIPVGTLDAATTADHGVTGSPRRWASGYPSMPVTLIERHGTASVGVIVDELEKAGRTTAGSIHEPLLSLLEKSTAAAWRDQYLDAEVDVSHVTWLFTANGLEGIPLPLRNRVRILRLPLPGREHVPALAARVMRDLLADQGIDPAWELPLDGEEIAALQQVCGEEVSVRTLQRYVEGILEARTQTATRN